MIKTKSDLIEYLEADKKALHPTTLHPTIKDIIWKYQIHLRKCEYFTNINRNLFQTFLLYWHKFWKLHYGNKCNFSIPLNCTGKGLCLAHNGPIIISEYAVIGDNCRIHSGVNIGADFRISDASPHIGNNVYIGPGAKIFGAIEIADGIAIGANAVVNKSFLEKNISIAGVPARKINEKGTKGVLW